MNILFTKIKNKCIIHNVRGEDTVKDFINSLLEKINALDSIGRLSLIRWSLLAFAVICILPCELVSGIFLMIFAILLWGSLIAFIVLSIIIFIKKKRAKANKSY